MSPPSACSRKSWRCGRRSNEARLISNAIRSAAILKSRTEDLQDLVSYRAGILSLKPGSVEVEQLLRGIASRLEPVAKNAGVKIHVETEEGLPTIIADPNRLDQIVSNIINNALKYAADGRRIDLRAFTRNGSMVIEVQDYGAGIDPAARSRPFQPSPRKMESTGDFTATGDFTGTGHRPGSVPGVAEQHGGNIIVATGEGKGSASLVELPLTRRVSSHEGRNHLRTPRDRRKYQAVHRHPLAGSAASCQRRGARRDCASSRRSPLT